MKRDYQTNTMIANNKLVLTHSRQLCQYLKTFKSCDDYKEEKRTVEV